MSVDTTLSASNTFSPWFRIRQGGQARGAAHPNRAGEEFLLSVSGTFVGTLTPQIRDVGQGESDIRDVPDAPITTPVEWRGFLKGNMEVRCGFKTGDYSSGSARVQIK